MQISEMLENLFTIKKRKSELWALTLSEKIKKIFLNKISKTLRNESGGFQSTQDTVVDLQALASLFSKVHVPNSNVDINLKRDDGTMASFNVNSDKALLYQKLELPKFVRNLEVTATGHGFSILQLSYQYNVNSNGE